MLTLILGLFGLLVIAGITFFAYLSYKISKGEIVLQITGTDAVTIESNLIYASTDDRDLRFDVYRPSGVSQPLPVVVLVHGGLKDWQVRNAKDWGVFRSQGRLVAASGMAAVTFNHRTDRVQATSDQAALIAKIRADADDLGIDRDRICIWAYSAGVPAALTAPLLERPEYLRCVVSYYGWLDVPETEHSPLVSINAQGRPIPPILVSKGALDRIKDINPSIDRFVTAAQQLGVSIELYTHEAGGHAFDSQVDDNRSREILQLTLDFAKRELTK